MTRNIGGFKVTWAGQQLVLVERSNGSGCEFNVSPDWRHVLGCKRHTGSSEDAALFEKEAGKAVEEFLRQERGDE
jgi:hypothetical protein